MCFILEVSVYMASNRWLNLPLITSCLLISEGFSPSNTSLLTSCCQLGGSISRSFSNCSSSLWLSPKAMLSNLRKQIMANSVWGLQVDNGRLANLLRMFICVWRHIGKCAYAYGGQRLALGVFFDCSSLYSFWHGLVMPGFLHGYWASALRSSYLWGKHFTSSTVTQPQGDFCIWSALSLSYTQLVPLCILRHGTWLLRPPFILTDYVECIFPFKTRTSREKALFQWKLL